MKVVWTKPGLADLNAVASYLIRENPPAAVRILERISRQTDDLAHWPYRGRVGRIPDTRELVVTGTPYIVPYRVQRDRIDILAVIHAARRWPKRL